MVNLTGRAILEALGAAQNIVEIDACMTRLRVTLKDVGLVDKAKLLELGALDVLNVNQGIHLIVGTKAAQYRDEIKSLLEG